MDNWLNLDWARLFGIDTPLLEIFLRGSLMYLALFVLLRVVLKRQSGSMSLNDLLVVVLLADAAQNGMAGDYRSIPEGILLVATILFWSYTLDWLGYRFPAIQRLIHPPELLLAKDGQLIRRNLRKEFITEDELNSALREQGVKDVSQTARVFMEGDGKISVVKKDQEQHNPPERKGM